ncbi:MAG: EamA family transporter [Rhodobacteraceae bacterium]|nr:EamA family transporter [Paracoccaceae bacterium]
MERSDFFSRTNERYSQSRRVILSIARSYFSSLGAILYLGLLSTACANLVFFHLVPRLGATRMAQINFAVPVGGALLGVVLLGEALTGQQLMALLLIIGSVYLGTSKG